jgi:hypothetical protein
MSKRQPAKTTKPKKAAPKSAAELHEAARLARRAGASPAEVEAAMDRARLAERSAS